MLEVKRDDMQRLLSALEDARDDMSAASNAIVSMLATLLPKAATSFTFNALAREMSPQLLDVLRILHPLSRKTVSEILADRMASEKISQAE
jgi:ABC-type transport system involved in multi-copper enzyme maturation permease subunit